MLGQKLKKNSNQFQRFFARKTFYFFCVMNVGKSKEITLLWIEAGSQSMGTEIAIKWGTNYKGGNDNL